MTEHDDRRIDALLRDLGPDVPRPALPSAERARLLEQVYQTEARRCGAPPRLRRWRAAAGLGLVLTLGSWAVLGGSLRAAQERLARSRWEAQETLQLLASARLAQPSQGVPADLSGLHAADLVLLTFDHELCPIARTTTPSFRSLAADHGAAGARFVVLDVTGDRRAEAREQIGALGVSFALLTPLGGETGVVKVLDTAHDTVLCSAPGQLGIQQAETLLARVALADQ